MKVTELKVTALCPYCGRIINNKQIKKYKQIQSNNIVYEIQGPILLNNTLIKWFSSIWEVELFLKFPLNTISCAQKSKISYFHSTLFTNI